MNKVSGLGRGLSSLIPKKTPNSFVTEENKSLLIPEEKNKIMEIPPEIIEVNPLQPRRVFGHEDLENLIESIKLYGIIQPLVVTKKNNGYELIAGERRLRAAKIIGLPTVPALIREADEIEKLELALIENIQRKNLNPMEKAISYRKLLDEFNLTQEDVSKRLGQNRSTVANVLRFLDLPLTIQEALSEGKISEGHAKIICGLPDEKKQLAFFEQIIKNDFSVRESEIAKPKRKNFAKPVFVKNSLLESLEEKLREALHTKARIEAKGEKGEIILEYYSNEDLHSIIDIITGGR